VEAELTRRAPSQVGDRRAQDRTGKIPGLVEDAEPEYAVIPMDSGDLSPSAIAGMSLDRSGELIAYVGRGRQDLGPLETAIQFLDRLTGTDRRVAVDLASSRDHELSRNGKRFIFEGFVTQDLISHSGIAMFDLEKGTTSLIVENGFGFFSIDQTGGRVAFQSVEDLDPRITNNERALRYFFYDETTGEIRQLTTDRPRTRIPTKA
jgi:hypothetical protein